jgi:hypothetical protein
MKTRPLERIVYQIQYLKSRSLSRVRFARAFLRPILEHKSRTQQRMRMCIKKRREFSFFQSPWRRLMVVPSPLRNTLPVLSAPRRRRTGKSPALTAGTIYRSRHEARSRASIRTDRQSRFASVPRIPSRINARRRGKGRETEREGEVRATCDKGNASSSSDVRKDPPGDHQEISHTRAEGD